MSGTVLLTGATGFVGRQVLRSLRARGVPVRAVVRRGREDALEGTPSVTIAATTSDLFAEDAAWWRAACTDVDTVIHAAWYAEPGSYLQSPANLSCLAGTLQCAQGAMAAGVRRVIGIGTCFEYALTGQPLAADSPLRPLTPYAAAKAAAFLALQATLRSAGVEFAWCRLFYMYGEGEDPRRLVAHLRARLAAGEPAELTQGHQVRDFLDVADVGRTIADVALSSLTGPYNVCSGEPVTVRALATRIAEEFGRSDLLRFGARPDNLVDPPHVVGVPGQGASTPADATVLQNAGTP